MADLVPDARLIFLVRDPVLRTIAEYVEEATWRVITEDIEAALGRCRGAPQPDRGAEQIATQLKELHRRYDPSRVLVVDLVELQDDPTETMQGIFEFLGLAPVELTEDGAPAAQLLRRQGHPILRGTARCGDPP